MISGMLPTDNAQFFLPRDSLLCGFPLLSAPFLRNAALPFHLGPDKKADQYRISTIVLYETYPTKVPVIAVIASVTTTTSVPVPANTCDIMMWDVQNHVTTGMIVPFSNTSRLQARRQIAGRVLGILFLVKIVEYQ